MSYIAVIGAGSWGTTLACLLFEKGYDVALWVHERELAEEINGAGRNSVYLPDVDLPRGLPATGDIREAVRKARYVVNVVPTQFTRAVFREVVQHIHEDALVISASKGIEQGSLKTVSEILGELSGIEAAVISGPSFAKEVIRRFPTAVTLAARSPETGLLLQEIFTTDYFRVYTHRDVLGVELGGALKNVIAIAAGICDGLHLGYNARAALITRGIAEITRLGERMGADKRTFSGLSGLGDLILTCTSPLSRNYTVGVRLGEGLKLSAILSMTRSVAEGIATAQSAFELSRRHGVEMPIVEQVYRVIYEDTDPAEAVRTLMTRSLKSEF
ncbi:MAG: NAD(P)-dependent glycerol-3-phosphate dehydrogenase [Candidatus Sulfobium sp.]